MQASKRRRVELDFRSDYASSGNQAYNAQPDNAQYLGTGNGYGSGHDVDHAGHSDFSLDVGHTIGTGQNGSTSTLATTATTSGQQWYAPPDSDAYPDTTTFAQQQQQQPYFSGYSQQSTDPSTYNSPWPPQAQAEAFAAQGSNYGAAASGTMPYYGTSETEVVNANGNYDGVVATSLQGYGRDVEMSAEYSYAAPEEQVQAVSLPPDESPAMVRIKL